MKKYIFTLLACFPFCISACAKNDKNKEQYVYQEDIKTESCFDLELNKERTGYKIKSPKKNYVYTDEIIIPSFYKDLPITEMNLASNNNNSTSFWYVCPPANYLSVWGVKIGYNVTSISGAFFAFENLKRAILPDSLISIGESAFSGCYSLESINIPKRLENIGSHAFDSCHFKSITIPKSIKTIDDNAFYNSGLEEVTFEGTMSEWEALNFKAFKKTIVIHCTDGNL